VKLKPKKKTVKVKEPELQFSMTTDVEDMIEESEEGGELIKYEAFLATKAGGDNVLFIMPGMKSSKNKTIVRRIIHGMSGACARVKKADRFEQCAECSYWFEHRTTKAQREAGAEEKPVDNLRPKDIGIVQIINLTWACEHKKVRNDKKEIVEVLKSSDIDMDRVKAKPCFLDLKVLNPEGDKCKNCPALYSCFQGPQFLLLSKPRVDELLTEQKRIGGNKIFKINDQKIKMRGNISMAWSVLHGNKKVAELVSYPMIYTKTIDPKLEKRYGTKYNITFSRDKFLLSETWQKRALARARDLGTFLAPISKGDAKKALMLFLKEVKDSDKPECFDDKEIKDTEHCNGEGCSYYEKCCVDKESKDNDKKKKNSKKKTKQEKAVEEMSDVDDDDTSEVDATIARMNKALEGADEE
jgi:hypothetical protein